MKHDERVQKGRREFLKGMVAAGGAATAVAVVTGAVADADIEPEVVEKAAPGRQGYRMTSHVQTYYDKARF